ncbi:MAG: type IV pilus assembly protein PilM [Armatimonadota bacterium]|nr:type IV pilus assembly protein PilM [Armatimonadota bacterium]
MAKQTGAVVGIDIGSQLIKIVEAKSGKAGVQLTGLAIAPTPDGVIENGVIINPAGLGAVIKKLLADNGIKAKQCVSAVSGQSSVVLRVIEVPKMNQAELAETMKWEVERQVPFSPTEVVMDFHPLEKPNQAPDAQNMEVLLAVAQQDMINSHVETLIAAGLKPVAIDVEPLAAGRAVIDLSANGDGEKTVAILNIGDTNADLCIFEGGMLTFPSPPMQVAGVNITRAISESLGESIEQAERLKKEIGKIDLERASTGSEDLGAPGMDPDMPAGSETIAFGTQAAPFDTQPQVEAETEPEAAPAADSPFDLSALEPAASSFTDTIDGPVFDLGGDAAAEGPALDTSGPAAPVFDLSDEPEAPSIDASAEDNKLDESAQESSATSGDLRTKVGDAIAPALMDLVSQLRLSLDYYKTRYQNQPEMIILSGGTARLPNLDRFLANELGMPVIVANPMANVTVATPRYSAQYISEVSPLFTICIGLAVRDML